MATIFLSHSSRDSEEAASLKRWLANQGFERVFLDFDKHGGIPPGANWEQRLYSEVAGAHGVILMLTPNWQESKWCWSEYTQARALGKPIFPVVVKQLVTPALPPDIQSVDVTVDPSDGLERLGRELHRLSREVTSYEWNHTRPPYPGLLAFDEPDAAVYFGRANEIRAIEERLNARRIVGGGRVFALLGASGVGKSSLLRAGLIPSLKKRTSDWIPLPPFRPQSNSVDALAVTFAIAGGSGDDWRTYREHLQADDAASRLSDLVTDLRVRQKATDAQLLISVDQADEMFDGTGTSPHELLSAVARLIRNPSFTVILALRSDYLGWLQRDAQRLQLPFEEVSVLPMPLERIPELIAGPARIDGLTVEAGLLSRAMQDAATEDALPLLAFTLRQLYEERGRTSKTLTLKDYLDLGDREAGLTPLENAVRKAADTLMKGLADEDLRALQRALVPSMARINDAGEYARRPARWADLDPAAHAVLEKFAQARLLVVGEEHGARIVEVAHEALLRKWPLLRGWLDDWRTFLLARPRLEGSLRDWKTADESTSALLQGLALSRAEAWLEDRRAGLTAEEERFIRASRAAADYEHARQQQLLQDLYLEHTTNLGRLAKQLMDSGKPFLALLAAAEALDQESVEHALEHVPAVPETVRIALQLLTRVRSLVFARSPERPSAVIVSQQGNYLLTISTSGRPALHREDNPPLELATADPAVPICAAFNASATHVVVGCHNGELSVWSVTDGSPVATLHAVDGAIESVTLDPTAQYAMLRTADSVHLWNVARNALTASLNRRAGGQAFDSLLWPTSLTITAASSLADRLAELAALPGTDGSKVSYQGLSPNGRQVLTLEDHQTYLWDACTGQETLTIPADSRKVTFSPDSRFLLTLEGESRVRIWDTASGAELCALPHSSHVVDACFSFQSTRIATAATDKRIRIWSASGELLHVLQHEAAPRSVAMGARTDTLAAVTVDGAIYIWDAANGHLTTRLSEVTVRGNEPATVQSADFMADDKRLLLVVDKSHLLATTDSNGERSAYLFNPKRRYDAWIAATAISADRQWLAVGYDDAAVCVWRAPMQYAPTYLFHHKNVAPDAGITDLAFTSDGARLVTVGADRVAKVWDLATGDQISQFDGHYEHGHIQKVRVNGTGTLALTCSPQSGDRGLIALLWDMATGEELDRFPCGSADSRWMDAMAVTAGGTLVTSTGRVELWRHPGMSKSAVADACRLLVPRALTSRERQALGVWGEVPNWQRSLWPYTDPVTLLTERMSVGFIDFNEGLSRSLRLQLDWLERAATQTGTGQVQVLAQAIFDAFADDVWRRLEHAPPFSGDISKLFEVVADSFIMTLECVLRCGDRAGARKMLEQYKGPVGPWYQSMKDSLGGG